MDLFLSAGICLLVNQKKRKINIFVRLPICSYEHIYLSDWKSYDYRIRCQYISFIYVLEHVLKFGHASLCIANRLKLMERKK